MQKVVPLTAQYHDLQLKVFLVVFLYPLLLLHFGIKKAYWAAEHQLQFSQQQHKSLDSWVLQRVILFVLKQEPYRPPIKIYINLAENYYTFSASARFNSLAFCAARS